MAGKVVLYGTDLSQPCRTVSWLLRAHNVPFEYEQVIPGAKRGTKSAEFQQKNKAGLVPVLEHNGHTIVESGAIIVYLAEVFNWTDVYPLGANEAGKRAAVNSWLHWAHRNSREFTIGLFAPVLRKDLKFNDEQIKGLYAACNKAAKTLEAQLAESKFLVGDKPTLADYAVYADVGQTAKEYLDLFDFTPYPKIRAWMARMRELPFHEETHETMAGLKGMIEQAKADRAKQAKL